MTTNKKHTETPYSVHTAGKVPAPCIYAGDTPIARVESATDADFIVTACNMHEELVRLARYVAASQGSGVITMEEIRRMASAILAKLPKGE